MRFTAYRALFDQPHVPRLALSGLLGRLPIGMTTLALVLFVAQQKGSFAPAGIAAGAFALATSIATPIQSRLIDRAGATRVLLGFVAVEVVAYAVLVLSGLHNAPTAALVAISALCGGARPALSPVMRTLWPVLVDDRARLDAAFALEGVLVEIFYTLGPLLTALVAALVSPALALAVAAGASLAGTTLFATTSLVRDRSLLRARPAPGAVGGLGTTGLRLLVGSMLALGFAFGSLDVGVPAFAKSEGRVSGAGLALSAMAFGSMLGGLWYGSHPWTLSAVRRWRRFALVFLMGCLPLLIAPNIVVLTLFMGLAGLAIAPLLTSISLLIEQLADVSALTEAYGWFATAGAAGAGAGAALVGARVAGDGVHVPFVFVCGAGAVVAAIAVLAGPRVAALTLPHDAAPAPLLHDAAPAQVTRG